MSATTPLALKAMPKHGHSALQADLIPRGVRTAVAEIALENRISSNAEYQNLMLALDLMDHMDAFSTPAE